MLIENYESHKNSSLSWLDTVPEHWNILALHFAARLNSGEAITALQFNEGGDYPVFGGNGYRGRSDRFTHDGIYVLIGRQGALCGNVNIAKGKFFASEHAIVVSPSMEFNPHWMAYNLQAMNLGQYSVSAAQPGLSAEVIGRLKIVFPPLKEQCAIAGFVDFKTAQIDALIAKKKALLEKLAEKRTAVISHAVTKGLDSSVPIKDSGSGWIGMIPEHWSVKRIKFVAKVGNGSTPSRENAEYWVDGVFPWLNSSVVNQDEVIESDQYVTELALKECHLPIIEPPAVLVGITGQGKTRGMSAKLGFTATINQHLVYVKPISVDISVDYLLYVFSRAYLYLRSESDAAGGTKGAITCEQIENLEIPFPPPSEQIEISACIGSDLDKISAMEKKIMQAVSMLQEYRSALITNAVTGKIDVRGFQVPADANAVTECNV